MRLVLTGCEMYLLDRTLCFCDNDGLQLSLYHAIIFVEKILDSGRWTLQSDFQEEALGLDEHAIGQTVFPDIDE